MRFEQDQQNFIWQQGQPVINYFDQQKFEQMLEQILLPLHRQSTNLFLEFDRCARRWKKETAFKSSISDIAMNPSYQRIIGMGKDALPFIFNELEREPDEWFWALMAITDENPVKPEERGYIDKMAKAWLRWAKEKGFG